MHGNDAQKVAEKIAKSEWRAEDAVNTADQGNVSKILFAISKRYPRLSQDATEAVVVHYRKLSGEYALS